MVDRIVPGYYAAGTHDNVYELIGRGFDSIPSNAVGILAVLNDEPLHYKDAEEGYRLFSVSEKSSTRLLMVPSEDLPHGAATYLGGIVSQDRSVVYWVNETRPLPN